MRESSYHNFLIEKYGSEEKLQEIHHYECIGVTNTTGSVIVEKGLHIPVGFAVTYFDRRLSSTVSVTNVEEAITNLVYENRIQDKKRNIFILKPEYLNVIFNDLENIMEYKKGSTQYVSETLKKTDNIRLYSN